VAFLKAISKFQITLKYNARTDEKAQHTGKYVNILKRLVENPVMRGNTVLKR
jgi:hypothetical protein